MKIGFIFLLSENISEELSEAIEEYVELMPGFKFCFVKTHSVNESKKLTKLSQRLNNAEVINVRTKSTEIKAIKAGARYLMNTSALKIIGYHVIKENDVLDVLENIIKYKDDISGIDKINELELDQVKFSLYGKVIPLQHLIPLVDSTPGN
jgi:hypothetical protein